MDDPGESVDEIEAHRRYFKVRDLFYCERSSVLQRGDSLLYKSSNRIKLVMEIGKKKKHIEGSYEFKSRGTNVCQESKVKGNTVYRIWRTNR